MAWLTFNVCDFSVKLIEERDMELILHVTCVFSCPSVQSINQSVRQTRLNGPFAITSKEIIIISVEMASAQQPVETEKIISRRCQVSVSESGGGGPHNVL